MEFSRMKYRRPLGKRPSIASCMKGTGSVGLPRPPHAPRGTPAQATNRVSNRADDSSGTRAARPLGKVRFVFMDII